MRIITFLFLLLALLLGFGSTRAALETISLKRKTAPAESKAAGLEDELRSLDRYRDEPGVSLDEFYLELFAALEEICSYYRVNSTIRIIGAKDRVDTREFFRKSQYRGIKYVDISIKAGLPRLADSGLLFMLYELVNSRPVQLLRFEFESNRLELTLRLYGT